MTFLRGYFPGKEALIAMIGYIAMQLTEVFFYRCHLLICFIRRTIYSADEEELFSFAFIPSVVYFVRQIFEFSFFRIARIFHKPFQTVMNRPYLCRCHLFSPRVQDKTENTGQLIFSEEQISMPDHQYYL